MFLAEQNQGVPSKAVTVPVVSLLVCTVMLPATTKVTVTTIPLPPKAVPPSEPTAAAADAVASAVHVVLAVSVFVLAAVLALVAIANARGR